MRHLKLVALVTMALAAIVLLAGCAGMFGPQPTIDRFEANVDEVSQAETAYFSVRGTTIGSGFSAFQDYEATISITGTGVVAVPRTVDGEFDTIIPVTFNQQGTIEVTLTLEAADGSTATDLAIMTVGPSRPNEGSIANPVRLDSGAGARDSQVGTGTFGSSYYTFTPTTNQANVNVDSVSPSADLDFYLYTDDGFTSLTALSTASGTEPTWTVNGLTADTPYYLIVTNFTNVSNVSFSLSVD